MLASGIIVFREMLEMCLVVGIIFAALDHIPNKISILLLGIFGGIILSLGIALLFYKATGFLSGDGQELLNIVILIASILCIALTILWINQHVMNLKAKVKDASFKQGAWPAIMVISLAIAREGAELTLFIHAIVASGTRDTDLIMGIIFGVILGISLGGLLYLGALKIPHRYFFKCINIMLALLSCAMATQLANYFTASDLISICSGNLWDSSWLISDTSILGRSLHSIIGYSATPTKLQAIFYIATLAIMTSILCISGKKRQ